MSDFGDTGAGDAGTGVSGTRADQPAARPRATTSPIDRTRALLIPTARTATVTDGYLDLLPDVTTPQPTPAQYAINNRVVATVYERFWRPAGVAAFGLYGLSPDAERARAIEDLRIESARTVLDVACGPGYFTGTLGAALAPGRTAVGLDISRPMLATAARTNGNANTAYVRADARALPFNDGTFDAVCCYAALYLVPEPLVVARELCRVLAPNGRIALMTSYSGENRLVASGLRAFSGTIGVRMFDRHTFPRLLAECGLSGIRQELHGMSQYICARKP